MKFKDIFKHRGTRVWFIVSAVIIALFLAVTIVVNTVLYPVVISVLGGERAVFAEGAQPIYQSDYTSKNDVLAAANEYNEYICEEGFVLLKNDDNALPLSTPESRANPASERPGVSIFGKNSVNIAYGGSGSGGGSGGGNDIYESLEAAGYNLNPTLREFYESEASGPARPSQPEGSNLDDGKSLTIPTYETPISGYSANVWNSVREYDDMAVIVITRMGGEGFDLPRTMDGVTGARNADDHYLQLDANETALINTVCNLGFERVVLLLNVGTSFELGFLEDATAQWYHRLKGYNIDPDKIDAAMWIGFPGNSGIMALGRILNGNVNPSGRTTDTYALDFKADPSWQNFGENLQPETDGVAGGDEYVVQGASSPADVDGAERYFVDYEEGVYVGYRYWETRGAGNDAWYNQHVVYPMGYGLSYTNFEWEVTDDSSIDGVEIAANGQYSITVRVYNRGSVAGKDVVQFYGRAPYNYEIEKPYEVLLDFAKTPLIQPGEYADVTLEFDPYYLASFDYNDANLNEFAGYELDGGEYTLAVCANAHEQGLETPFTVAEEGIKFENDPVTGSPVNALYTNGENAYLNSDYELSNGVLSRAAWDATFPAARTAEERTVTPEFIQALADVSADQAVVEQLGGSDIEGALTMRDLLTDENGVFGIPEGQDAWEAFVGYDDERWNKIIDQISLDEMVALVSEGAFKSNAIESIGKPLTNDTDGPAGFVNFMLNDGTYNNTCYYAAQIVVASTWSEEVAQGFGEMVGEEGIIGADGRGNGLAYSGWYAPGANIHRSQFGGRNFEYMSEDGVLTGKMAAAQMRGCQSKGVYCFMKHFALNDQETHRSNNGVSVWVTEQAMREIYLRPFEIAVKEGQTRAVMSSFNRIGVRWAGGDYRLLTAILRDEWGFEGTVVTDFVSGSYMNTRQMLYAGGSLNLNNQQQYNWNDFDANNANDVAVLKARAKDILYTVANSNAFNREVVGYMLPMWEIWLIVADCVVVAGIAVWGFFAIRKVRRKLKVSDQSATDS